MVQTLPQPAGNRNHRIRIERATLTANDIGEQVPTAWTLLVNRWVDVDDRKGSTLWQAEQVAAETDVIFESPYIGNSLQIGDNGDRVIWRDRVYSILSVTEARKNTTQKLFCKSRAEADAQPSP